jgi:hypothetical protein
VNLKKICTSFPTFLLLLSLSLNVFGQTTTVTLPVETNNGNVSPNVHITLGNQNANDGFLQYSGSNVPLGNGGYGGMPGGFDPSMGFGGYGNAGIGINGLPGVTNDPNAGGCPFTNQDKSVEGVWKSTKETLKQIAQKKEFSQACTLVQSNSGNLQRALAKFENQTFRPVDGAMTAYGNSYAQLSGNMSPDCVNYVDLYQNEYEQMLSLVAKDYELSSMPGDYRNGCIKFYPDDGDDFKYSSEFITCLGDVLSKKIEVAHIQCKGKTDHLDKIEMKRDLFKAKQESLLDINSALSALSKNIYKCDNKDLVESSLKSIITIGSKLAAPLTGGIGGVAAAFGGNVLENLVSFLFSKGNSRDLAAMEKEEKYNQMACLFYNAQKIRCSSDKFGQGMMAYGYGGGYNGYGGSFGPSAKKAVSCADIKREEVNNKVEELTGFMFQTVSQLPTGRKTASLLKFLNEKNKIFKNQTPMEFLKNKVLKKLGDERLYSDKAKLEKFVAGVEHLSTLDKGLQNGTIKSSAPYLNSISNETKPAFEVLKELEDEVMKSDFSTALYTFKTIDTPEDAVQAARNAEYIKMITEQSVKSQKNALFSWKNTRTLDMSITVMVNNLKDEFEDTLEDHFKSGFKSAINLEKENRTAAFNQLSGIINDCLFTESMYKMKSSNIQTDALSTTKIGNNPTYKRYCEKIKCQKIKDNNLEPEKFKRRQCAELYGASWKINQLKAEFENTGKICGSSLKEIYEAGK